MSNFWNTDKPLTGDQYEQLMFYMMIASAVFGILWRIFYSFKEKQLYPNLIKTFILAYVYGWISLILGALCILSALIGGGMLIVIITGNTPLVFSLYYAI